MGLIDDELKQLKDLVSSLESRIKKLESPGSGPSSTEQLRMILIGPPGAGTQFLAASLKGLSIVLGPT
jgi:adenylate kinase